MTDEATRLALADEIEESFNDDRMLDLVLLRDERRLIVAALRAIPQKPVAWRWKDTSDDWLYIETEPTLLTTGRLNEVEPLYAGPIQNSDGGRK